MSDYETSTQTDALAPETIFSLLSDERRRHVVAALADRTTEITLDELVSTITSRNLAGSEATDPAATKKRIKIALHHVHLPKLDDAGVVEYDPDARTVTPVALDQFTRFLELGDEQA